MPNVQTRHTVDEINRDKDPDRVSTTRPLTKVQLDLLFAKVPTFPGSSRYEGLDPVKVIRFMLATGIHPHSLEAADACNLRVEGPYALWERAKNKNKMKVPLPPEVQPWAQDFVEGLPRYSTMVYNNLVHEIGTWCGLQGLSPRTLRHTAAKVFLSKSGNVNDLKRWMGATREIALDYAEAPNDSDGDEKILGGKP